MKKCCGLALPVLLGFAVLLAMVPSALANRPREHDGFFMRLSAGGGHARTEISNVYDPDLDITSDLEFSGTAAEVNLAVGAVVSTNLALHGTLAGWTVSDPDVKFGGAEGQSNNVDITMSMVGGGVTYYFMPSNFYISGSIGAAQLNFDVFGQDEDSDIGVAMDLSAGKEWWVGRRWGLGIAGGVNLHSIPGGDLADEDFTGSSFALRFSATFN